MNQATPMRRRAALGLAAAGAAALADGSVPSLDHSLAERFPQYDPLKKT